MFHSSSRSRDGINISEHMSQMREVIRNLAPQIERPAIIFQWQMHVQIELILQLLSLSVHNVLLKFIDMFFDFVPSMLCWHMDYKCIVCELHFSIIHLKSFSYGISVLLLSIDNVFGK